MNSLAVTTLYAGILGLLLLALSLRVIVVVRAKGKVALGDGGNADYGAVIRGQQNFVEYVPVALILIGLAEYSGTAPWIIHVLGVVLVIARLLHPLGLTPERGPTIPRLLGTVATLSVVGVAAIVCLIAAIGAH